MVHGRHGHMHLRVFDFCIFVFKWWFGGFNYSNDGDSISCLGKREELELVMTKKTYFK